MPSSGLGVKRDNLPGKVVKGKGGCRPGPFPQRDRCLAGNEVEGVVKEPASVTVEVKRRANMVKSFRKEEAIVELRHLMLSELNGRLRAHLLHEFPVKYRKNCHGS
jgi:hypothetical protein